MGISGSEGVLAGLLVERIFGGIGPVAPLLSESTSAHDILEQSICVKANGSQTIISSLLSTLMPFLLTSCRYRRPEMTSCCTRNLTLMWYELPSLITKGFFFKASTAPEALRSITASGRPSTRSESWRITTYTVSSVSLGNVIIFDKNTLRLSPGSPREPADAAPIPSDAFQRARDSSSASR